MGELVSGPKVTHQNSVLARQYLSALVSRLVPLSPSLSNVHHIPLHSCRCHHYGQNHILQLALISGRRRTTLTLLGSTWVESVNII